MMRSSKKYLAKDDTGTTLRKKITSKSETKNNPDNQRPAFYQEHLGKQQQSRSSKRK